MTRDTEQLLRSVLNDPAFDLTPDGDPLAPVWGKARAIRRRRALTASGTVIVVAAAAVLTGIAVTRPEANDHGVVQQPTPTASIAPTPSTSAVPRAPTFPRTHVHVEEPFVVGDAVIGLETGEGGPTSFRVVRLDTRTGTVSRSAVTAATAGGITAVDGVVWVTSPGTDHLLRFDLADLSRLSDVVDPNGIVSGPIAALGGSVAVADRSGISRIRGADATPATSAGTPARICSLITAPSAGGLLILGGDKGGACRDVVAYDPTAPRTQVVATASDLSLGLEGVVADDRGFWVEQPTGTMGYYEHVAFVASSGQLPVVAPDHVDGSNAMQLSVADGHAWISDPGVLQCADSDGHVLWRKNLSVDDGAAHVFAVGAGAVLVTNTYAEPFNTQVCTGAGSQETNALNASAATSAAAP